MENCVCELPAIRLRLSSLAEKPYSWCGYGLASANKARAASLIELIVAITLILIMASISVQAWRPTAQRAALDVVQQNLQNTLLFAQSSAMALGESVEVCGGDQRCDGQWSHGVSVRTVAGRLLRVWGNTSSVSIVWNSSFDQNNRLIFQPSGFTLGQQGRFYLCDNAGNASQAVAIVVAASGRLRVDRRSAVRQACAA